MDLEIKAEELKLKEQKKMIMEEDRKRQTRVMVAESIRRADESGQVVVECTYIYIYIYIYVYIYIYIYMYELMYIYVLMYVYIYCTYVYLCTYMYKCKYILPPILLNSDVLD
jgi:hypothetical protein